MRPILINPPAGPVVALSDLKEHLRVVHAKEDALIAALEIAAVAHLDGWTGILGRCILPQTWALDLAQGKHVLPFPDVTVATLDVDTDPLEIEIERCEDGPTVNLPRAGQLHFTCAMSEQLLPAAQVAVKMWVSDAYKNREAGAAGQGAGYQRIVSALKWWRA